MANVICPQCGESYHETTDAYRPGIITTGNMLRLKKQYALNGWPSFPEHEGMMLGDLFCPGCGGMYSDNGVVRVDMAQWGKEYVASFKTAPVSTIITKTDRKNFEMDALMAEYDPEPPPIHTVMVEQAWCDSFKDGAYHKAGTRRKPGRQKR